MAGTKTTVLQAWLPRIAITLALGSALACTWLLLSDCNVWLAVFCTFFGLRYTRFIGHLIGAWSYKPSLVQPDPSFTRHDVTVIVPTVDPAGPVFPECIRSILANGVAQIIVVTAGADLKTKCRQALKALAPEAGETSLVVSAIAKPSKRRQIRHAMSHVSTPITILADEGASWPSMNFIPSVLAPFENQKVGVVAPKKRARRTTPGKWSWQSIVNFIATNYLERHNWELKASNAIDGGVFVVSGRTAVYRTEFLANQALLDHFCNEKFFFGLFGGEDGLGPYDDNFLTRAAIKNGWLIRFQDTEEATVEVTLGEWPRFHSQLLRWARTTFRSNPVMLRDPDFFKRYTWSMFMVYWAGITNFALLWDSALILSLVQALEATHGVPGAWLSLALLLVWIIATKTVKIIPNLYRHPADLALLGFQIAFAYVHSFYKLWALVTFWDCSWSGRKLDGLGGDESQDVEAFVVVV